MELTIVRLYTHLQIRVNQKVKPRKKSGFEFKQSTDALFATLARVLVNPFVETLEEKS